MAMTKKTITVTHQQEQWIRGRVESGDYGNDSEYFRDLIRRDQEKRGLFPDLDRSDRERRWA